MATGERHVRVKEKKIVPLKFCPKCGSTDVFWAQGLPQLWSLWQCRNCGYYGSVILEDGKLATILQEKWREKNKQENQ